MRKVTTLYTPTKTIYPESLAKLDEIAKSVDFNDVCFLSICEKVKKDMQNLKLSSYEQFFEVRSQKQASITPEKRVIIGIDMANGRGESATMIIEPMPLKRLTFSSTVK